MRIPLICLLAILSLGGCLEKEFITEKACANKKWDTPEEHLDCLFPHPPIGRSHAVYTNEFAKKYNLSRENISYDLSPGIDYMEMDVQNYGTGTVACLVNILVKKPHDISFVNLGEAKVIEFPQNRKVANFIDLNELDASLKATTVFHSASRDYQLEKRGFRASTFAMYSENVLSGYDYITANQQCRLVSLHPEYFPNGYALWVGKASVWGRYETPYGSDSSSQKPRGDDFYNSHFFINIPHELISKIFQDVTIGRK